MPVRIKRVYDQPEISDGLRVLVDRLWPRGLAKDKARVDLWAKDVAPSSKLRKWFAHREDRWEDFQRRYRAELLENAALDELCAKSDQDTVTLLYAARDQRINHARVLAAVIAERTRRQAEPDWSAEDAVEVSSPPCFVHELDPAWQGTERRDDSGETADHETDEQPSQRKTRRADLNSKRAPAGRDHTEFVVLDQAILAHRQPPATVSDAEGETPTSRILPVAAFHRRPHLPARRHRAQSVNAETEAAGEPLRADFELAFRIARDESFGFLSAHGLSPFAGRTRSPCPIGHSLVVSSPR